MKAISLKPAGTALNFRIFAVFNRFMAKYALFIASITAVLAILSMAWDVYFITIAAASVSLGAVYFETEIKKGGVA